MTPDDARALVLRLLGDIAPDADLDTLDPAADLQEEVELDSMDAMNLVTAISEETGTDIPDATVRRTKTLDDWVAVLAGG
jgi:acyl carrier protein